MNVFTKLIIYETDCLRIMLTRLKSPYVAVTLVFTALFIAMFRLMPVMHDDIWYRYYLYDYMQNPTWDNFLKGFLDNFEFRSTKDNIRIPNLIMPVLIGFTNWIPAILNGCCLGLTVWLGAKLTGIWRRSVFCTCSRGHAICSAPHMPPTMCRPWCLCSSAHFCISDDVRPDGPFSA